MQLSRLMFKDRSLWYKFSLISVLPTILVAAFLTFNLVGSVERTMLAEAGVKADELTELTRLSMSNALVIYNKKLLDNYVDGLGRIQSVRYALVLDSNDQLILAHNDHRMDGKHVTEVTDLQGLLPNAGITPAGADTYYRTAAPIVIDAKEYATLHIGFSFNEVHQQTAALKKSIIWVAAGAVFVGALLSLFVARIISTPMRALARQARQAGMGDFDHPLIYDSRDALGLLAENFNRMLADIKVKQYQLRAVNTIADTVYRSLDTPTVACSAVTAMIHYSHSPAVAIFEFNQALNHLELLHSQGFDREALEKAAVLPLDGSLTGMAVQRRQIMSSTDLESDNRVVSGVRKALSDNQMKSVISIPLLAQDHVMGAMNLIYKTRYQLSDSEKETLMSIGKTIALAMSNARQVTRIQNEIRERKETEKALRDSEDKYRNLVERANDGIVIIQEGLIRYANPSIVALSGGDPDNLINQPFTNFIHPSEKTRLKALYERRMGGDPSAAIYETVVVRNDGKHLDVEINSASITYLNQPADLVIIRDITDRKRARETLRKAYDELEVKVAERTVELAVAKERAEESDRLKSAFLAAMSHELRTPLNSIIGFTGIILQELVGPLNAEQAKQLTMVQDSAHHLLSLINDVLDLSKIEAGQLNVTSETFAMRAVIEQATCTVSPLASQKGLEIITEISDSVGVLTSDRRRVEQILLNLLNNAVKFTESGGVHIRCETDGQWITTQVTDSGIGIAPGDLDKLFRAFQQIETGLARRFEGTGLGLSICKKLVERLGGKIEAYSRGPGCGATFTFSLPSGPDGA
jgi:PAS domain S-box-containing protein